jgi:hypothetical protein
MEIKKSKKQKCEINKNIYIFLRTVERGKKNSISQCCLHFLFHCCLCLVSKNQNNKKISTKPVAFIIKVLAFCFFLSRAQFIVQLHDIYCFFFLFLKCMCVSDCGGMNLFFF